MTTLVLLGPGADREQRQRALNGGFYSGVAIEVHFGCATGIEL
ncbi:MAG: hypothetical protein ACR2NO_01375 [Chloroflexota bacterium]